MLHVGGGRMPRGLPRDGTLRFVSARFALVRDFNLREHMLEGLTKEEAQLTREKDKIQMGRAEQHVSQQRDDGESERLQPWRKRPPQTLRRRSCAATRSCWRTDQS